MLVIRASTAVGSWNTGNMSLKMIPYVKDRRLFFGLKDEGHSPRFAYLLWEVSMGTQHGLDALNIVVWHCWWGCRWRKLWRTDNWMKSGYQRTFFFFTLTWFFWGCNIQYQMGINTFQSIMKVAIISKQSHVSYIRLIKNDFHPI